MLANACKQRTHVNNRISPTGYRNTWVRLGHAADCHGVLIHVIVGLAAGDLEAQPCDLLPCHYCFFHMVLH